MLQKNSKTKNTCSTRNIEQIPVADTIIPSPQIGSHLQLKETRCNGLDHITFNSSKVYLDIFLGISHVNMKKTTKFIVENKYKWHGKMKKFTSQRQNVPQRVQDNDDKLY